MQNKPLLPVERKPYEAARVTVHGSLEHLTLAVDKAGNADGGMGNDKT